MTHPRLFIAHNEIMSLDTWKHAEVVNGDPQVAEFQVGKDYIGTPRTPQSAFDQSLGGKGNALNESERGGLKLFMDKGCAGCHGGVNMGGGAYYPFGVVAKPSPDIMKGDAGRFKVTGGKSDEYMFKAPSLRNIVRTPPYFHARKIWNLKDAIEIMGNAQLGVTLDGREIDLIEAFLATTTGEQPAVMYPFLPASTDSTPKPQLD